MLGFWFGVRFLVLGFRFLSPGFRGAWRSQITAEEASWTCLVGRHWRLVRGGRSVCGKISERVSHSLLVCVLTHPCIFQRN